MRFVTIRTDKNITDQHLYKDVGGIPYALSKYLGNKATFIYFDYMKILKHPDYEKFVKIVNIKYSSVYLISIFRLIKFIINNANEYDVLNIYHSRVLQLLIASIAKIKNPHIKIYAKLDLNRKSYYRLLNDDKKDDLKYKLLVWLNRIVDLYTVETKSYVLGLNKIKKFGGKVKYLPNGFFSDLVDIGENNKKENIILTVGRLGSDAKNTEMLIKAIENIDPMKLDGWKVYLVGTMTEEFKKYFNNKLQKKPYLKRFFVITGNISDKKELYTIYSKSSVFVLTSRWEGFPLVLPEALSFGCYPIVTNCFDAVNDIVKESFGKTIENENLNELQLAIEDVLDEKINYIQKGKEASLYTQVNFNWCSIAKQLNEYLRVLK